MQSIAQCIHDTNRDLSVLLRDEETLDWAASTEGYDRNKVQDVMQRSVERCFGNSSPASPAK